jgi:hypothetical protein
MSICKDLDLLLWTSQHSDAGLCYVQGGLLYLQILHTTLRISPPYRKR